MTGKIKKIDSTPVGLVILLLIIPLLFYACTGNKNISDPAVVMKLKPSANNPRNSEGDFIKLKDGMWIIL